MNTTIFILLLEDRADDAELILGALDQSEITYKFICVKTKEQYLEHLTLEIDLILADYTLPRFDALQALHLLKDRSYLDIPFIVVSGAISDEAAVECMKNGAVDYLLKDRLGRLGHAVKQALHEKALRAEARLFEEAERQQHELALALYTTMRTLTSSLNLDTVMTGILENAARVVPHDVSNIMIIEGEVLRVAYHRGYSEEAGATLREIRFSLKHPLFAEVLQSGTPMLIPDTQRDPLWTTMPHLEWIRSNLCIPIVARSKIIGFLNLDSGIPQAFTQSHVEWLLAFASQTAVTIENAQLYEAVRQHAAELEERVEERTRELREAKDHLEIIINSTSDAIMLLDADDILTQVNPSFLEMFGFQTDTLLLGQLVTDLFNVSAEKWAAALDDLRDHSASVQFECVMQRHNGTVFYAEVALALVGGDSFGGIVCSLRDISAHKATEEMLRVDLGQERELRELKSRFIAIVSHEFRNPLSVIQFSASTLENYMEKLSNERRAQHFENIHSQVDHMTALLEDVLTIESTESGRKRARLTPTNVAALCQTIVDNLQRVDSNDHHIIYTNQSSLSEPALIDTKLMRQLIINLISNAIKYSPSGSTVTVQLFCDSQTIELSVKDEGIGIPENEKETLFQPFNRASNTGDIQGTGLGLVIAKNAVELHGGTIRVESKVGFGTTFFVTIPVVVNAVV